jgi:serine/threonine-protein kinase
MTGQAHFEEQLKTQLAPDFEVKRLIGTGSKASVYLAREAALKRLVAIKVLKPQLAADETARKRFEREAQSAAQISHPNVAKIYTVGRLEGDVPYLVMEYIDGRTLEEALKATGLLPVKDARRVIRDLAGALEAAHGKRIIHRDVRPANVLVENETKRVVLTDFGIAAILESGGSDVTRLTMEGQLLGEMRYMSPEQLQGERATEQADLYSLGILGFELLTGESPYRVNSDIELAAAHLRSIGASPSSPVTGPPRPTWWRPWMRSRRELVQQPVVARTISVPGRNRRWARSSTSCGDEKCCGWPVAMCWQRSC